MYICTVLLPPGGYPIAVNKYISYHISYHIPYIKNMVERGRQQMAIWCMCIACWIPKATNTHSQYVLLIAFPPKQWLRERASTRCHLCSCTKVCCEVLCVAVAVHNTQQLFAWTVCPFQLSMPQCSFAGSRSDPNCANQNTFSGSDRTDPSSHRDWAQNKGTFRYVSVPTLRNDRPANFPTENLDAYQYVEMYGLVK